MPKKKPARRPDVIETKIRVTKPILDRMIERSIILGWSLDTCARRAMKAWARKHGVPLRRGGDWIEVKRRADDTLRSTNTERISVSYPARWKEILEDAVAAHPVHGHQAALWREAMLCWLDSEPESVSNSDVDSQSAA